MTHAVPPGCVVDTALRDLPRHYWPDAHRAVSAALPRARRFVLDADASSTLGRIVASTEDLLLRNLQFALPPYEHTYLELDSRAFHDGLARPTAGSRDTADRRVGYLITPSHVWSMCEGSERTVPSQRYAPTPFCWLRNNSHPLYGKLPARLSNQQEWAELVLMLGSSYHALPSEDVRRWLLDNFSMTQQIGGTDGGFHWSEEAMLGSAGDLRTCLSLLLVLNCPTRFSLLSVAPRRGIQRGRPVVYAAHSVVSLQLGRARDWRSALQHDLAAHDRASPRRHEVRGHFRHRGGSPSCTHDWPLLPTPSETPSPGRSPAPTWSCRRCGRHRTWVAEHARGDAARGFVTKHYEVATEST